LLAAPLPELIKGLGLAVADANIALQASEMVYTIDEAEIELKIAISIDTSSKMDAGASFGLKAFSVNASYAKTYGYKEEASSSIKMTLKAVPRNKISQETVEA
jgi:putative effector of murein hydrolase